MTITVVGTGFVGLVTAAVFASFGHTVYGLDIDEKKIDALRNGKTPFFEPQLDQLLRDTLAKKTLHFSTSYEAAVPLSQLVIIAVGTPSAESGGVDLRFVKSAISSISPQLQPHTIVAIKSTVPPHAVTEVKELLSKKTTQPFSLATIPEFLREGSAVADTLSPARIVIGAEDDATFATLESLHQPFQAPIVRTKLASAQMAKYAANAYLATRITFINQIADLCEKNNADVEEVIAAIGFDPRIRSHYWYPGLGYGGSCFPKDVKELAYFSRQVGEADNLFNKIQELNEKRLVRLFDKFTKFVGGWQNKTVAVLGLAFKPNTDDTREAPSTKIVPWLLSAGATVQAFDPKATLENSGYIHSKFAPHYNELSTIKEACKQADVLLLITEWPEIGSFDFSQVKSKKTQYMIDTRNQLSPKNSIQRGFTYLGIGRTASK